MWRVFFKRIDKLLGNFLWILFQPTVKLSDFGMNHSPVSQFGVATAHPNDAFCVGIKSSWKITSSQDYKHWSMHVKLLSNYNRILKTFEYKSVHISLIKTYKATSRTLTSWGIFSRNTDNLFVYFSLVLAFGNEISKKCTCVCLTVQSSFE